MAETHPSPLLHHLRHLIGNVPAAALSDSQLLERFLGCRDETAVEVLVRRHGPLVFGVCRRVLHDAHAAEDAFQATFLVLVHKAASVVPRHMVGNWLYGVARQTAVRARAAAAKRRLREKQAMRSPVPEVAPATANPPPRVPQGARRSADRGHEAGDPRASRPVTRPGDRQRKDRP